MATPEPIRDPILDKPLPSSPETEKAILGAIILDNTVVAQAIEERPGRRCRRAGVGLGDRRGEAGERRSPTD